MACRFFLLLDITWYTGVCMQAVMDCFLTMGRYDQNVDGECMCMTCAAHLTPHLRMPVNA